MNENNVTVQLGDGVADDAKSVINQELKELLRLAIQTFSKLLKNKIPELPEKIANKIEEMSNRQDALDDVAEEWSKVLFEKGLVKKGYAGLPDELLISNFHQEGYLDGIYVGYVLALISLVDNEATEELICSVRDDIRANLIGHHYNDRNEFTEKYKDEKYYWVERLKTKTENE